MGWGNFLKEGGQGGLPEEVEYEQKHQAIKSVRHENNSRKEVLGRGNSRCKGPEVRIDTALQGKTRRPLWLQHVTQNCEWGEEGRELEASQSTKSTGEELELILSWVGSTDHSSLQRSRTEVQTVAGVHWPYLSGASPASSHPVSIRPLIPSLPTSKGGKWRRIYKGQ